jgi:hypothetical protein
MRILITEDDAVSRIILQAAVEQFGHDGLRDADIALYRAKPFDPMTLSATIRSIWARKYH